MTLDPFYELAHGVLDDADIDLINDPALVADVDAPQQQGNAWPPQVRAYALRLWTFEAGHNPGKVSDILKERSGLDIGAPTIRRWSLLEDWENRAVGLHQAFSHSSQSAVKAHLSRVAVIATQTLEDVMTDPEATSGARVKAAMFVLGVNGYVPVMQGQTINLAVNVGRDRLAQASDEELLEMQESYKPDEDHTPDPEVTDAEYRLASRTSRHTGGSPSDYTHDMASSYSR